MTHTSTVTQLLLVNPAFLQEIKDSNPDLWQAMHQLRQTCDSDEAPAPLLRKLVRLLDDLRDRWAMQFALEESYGYMQIPQARSFLSDQAADRQALFDQAEATHAQHCGLYLQLSELAEHAEELQYRGVTTDQLRRLIDSSRAFDEAVQQHERCEHDLIELSFGASV